MSQHPGEPELGPWLLPDQTDVYELVADGEIDRLGFVPRFRPANRGKRIGDLLWTTGADVKIASRRFIDVLEGIDATGYRTFPVDVATHGGDSLGEFVGLAVVDGNPYADLHFSNGVQFWQFAAGDRVVAALRDAGVTALSITPVSST